MNHVPQLYLKLFGNPCFCFQTQSGKTPLIPLPTPLWTMLLAYLATCENQEASLDVLAKVWNEAGDGARNVYSQTDNNDSARIAKSALATAIAKARKELVKHCEKALRDQGIFLQEGSIDSYTYLPKHQEKIIYLNPQLVSSDVGRFVSLLKEAGNLQEVTQHQEQVMHLLREAKALYSGEFMQDGDAYFGRADFRRGEQAEGRALRPWIKRARGVLANLFDEVQSRINEDARSAFRYLPVTLDSFVVRDELSQHIRRWLLARGEAQAQPLLMLHGPGGAGKTRLAIESIRSLHDSALHLYRDRIYFVSFGSAYISNSIYSLAQTIASALQSPRMVLSSTPENITLRLREWLVQGPMRLLVLDNFESITANNSEAGAWLVELLQHTNGQLRCLVTSQHSFARRIPHYEVGGMSIPVSEDDPVFDSCESTTLFLRRVQETIHHGNYKLTRHIRRNLLELFIIVSGLPLGVEILAARYTRMSPSDLQEAVTNLKNKREHFDLLQDTDDLLRTATRHSGMRACIAWTWELLPSFEQRLIARLGVFPDTFTEDAAHVICEVTIDHLRSWADLALVRWDNTDKRWALLPLIREFAFEKLQFSQETDRFCHAFCQYYIGVLEGLSDRLQTKEFHQAAQLLDKDEKNFVMAQRYCIEASFTENVDMLLRYAIALRSYRFLRSDRFRTIEELELAVMHAKGRAQASLYRLGLCTLITSYGSPNSGSDRMEYLRAELESFCLDTDNLSPEELRALGTASINIEQKLFYIQAAIEGYKQAGNIIRKVVTMNALASILSDYGRIQESLDMYRSLLPEAIESGWYAAAVVASNAAYAAVALGNEQLAEMMFRQSLKLCRENNLELIASWVLLNYAMQKERIKEYRSSAILLIYGEKLRHSAGGGYEILSPEEENFKQKLIHGIGEHTFEEASSLASHCSVDSAVSYALSLQVLFHNR